MIDAIFAFHMSYIQLLNERVTELEKELKQTKIRLKNQEANEDFYMKDSMRVYAQKCYLQTLLKKRRKKIINLMKKGR